MDYQAAASASSWGRVSGYGMDGAYHMPQTSVRSMAVFQGELYAGTSSYGPADIWKLGPDGWVMVDPPGFDSESLETGNFTVTSMAVFRNPLTLTYNLYVGTGNPDGCEIWRFDGSSWSRVVGPGGVVGPGFGDPHNRGALSMAVFGDFLYVGTARDTGELQVWRTNGSSWTRVDGDAFSGTHNQNAVKMCVFGGYLYLGTENNYTGCEIWRTANGTTWNAVSGWGFGTADNRVASSMAVFNSRLYVGTRNTSSGAWVVRTTDGISWGRVDGGVLGTANTTAASLCAYGGQLYLGTENDITGAQVWRSPDGVGWSRCDGGSLGEVNDTACSMLVHGGLLYVGTEGGGAIFHTDGSSWELSNQPYFTSNSNCEAACSAVLGSFLYVGTESLEGGEVWRHDGSSWSKVGSAGLGDPDNLRISCLGTYGGKIYAGTGNDADGCRVYRFDEGSGFVQVSADGFGDPANYRVNFLYSFAGKLFAGTSSRGHGGQLWAYDGAAWTKVSADGFGSINNKGMLSFAVHGGLFIYVGTENNTGCQVWRSAMVGGPPYTDWTKVNADGFDGTSTRAVSMADFGGRLFVGTYRRGNPCDLWCYDGSWEKAAASGFGKTYNWAVSSMVVHDGRLYVGTESYPYAGGAGCEVWSTGGTGGLPFSDWRQENDPGFGDVCNYRASFLASYFDRVHAGTRNDLRGCAVWTTGSQWYLAEGATDLGFETYVLVQNPGVFPVHVDFVLNTGGGEVRPADLQNVEIPAGSRRTFNLGAFVTTSDVSTKVTCRDGTVLCERAVYWRPSPGSPWAVGHDSVGTTRPSRKWYLAEGATDLGFETYVLVQNPGSSAARVDFTLQTGGGEVRPPELQNVEIPAGARRTFNLGNYVITSDVSTTVVSRDVPVVCERAMYWRPSPGSPWAVGHDSVGLTISATTWYFAEGATDLGFETYVLVQSAGESPAHVNFILNTGGGEVRPPELQNVEIPVGARRTFNLGRYVTTTDLAVKVECVDEFVVCERSVYWRPSPGSPWTVGHNGTGVIYPKTAWYLAEGATDLGFETYVLVQNPGPSAARVDFTLQTGGGEVRPADLQNVEIPAGARRTFNLGPYVTTTDVSVKVVARGGPVICERAVYWRPSPGSPWAVGHDSVGVTP